MLPLHELKNVTPTVEPQEHRIVYLVMFDNAEGIKNGARTSECSSFPRVLARAAFAS